MARDCPQGGGNKCFKCNEEGHMSRECPSGGGDGTPRPCYKCHSTEHTTKDCTEEFSALDAEGKPREQYVPEETSIDEIFKGSIASGTNFSNFEKVALQVSGDDVPQYIQSFEGAGLRALVLENVKKSGYKVPTPVQKASIACILARRDLMACAATGSGKTAAYLVPVINILLETGVNGGVSGYCQKPEVVVMSPTRELAIQIYNEACKFSHNSVLKTVIVYGGTVVGHQKQKLAGGCNILIGTPGRLNHFVENGFLDFSNIKYFILDEADRMLDEGFGEDIKKVCGHPTMPPKGQRRTLMFSATFPPSIQNLAMQQMVNHIFVATGVVGGTNPDVEQRFLEVPRSEKKAKLADELRTIGEAKTIVFVDSKKTADFVASYLSNDGFKATSIHGDRMQSQREMALSEFRRGIRNILVATNVAARGLDIVGVDYVINYDLCDPEEYVHRIGRTGRVGNTGCSITFYDPDKDSDKAGPLVAKLAESHAEVPQFLQDAVGGVGGYNFGMPSQSAFGGRDVRTFGGGSRGGGAAAPPPTEAEEAWD